MIKPVNTYVLLEIEKEEEKTAGGLYMPQGSNANATNILREGTVKEVSEKVSDKVKVADKVYFNKHSVTKIPNSETEVLVRFEDLYAIIN